MSARSSSKRPVETLDLVSTDEDEPRAAPPASKKQASSASPAGLTIPSGANRLRGVTVPAGWSVHGGSLLVKSFGAVQPSAKVAAFDFDGCLADTPLGGNDPKAWKMQFSHVPQVLRSLADSGHAIVIVTNESMDRLKKPEAISNNILKKVGRLEGFAAAAGVPLLALCATAKDQYRKPAIGAWTFFDGCNGGVAVDMAASFFVGDAAGRPGDHSDSDRAFAKRASLTFHDEKSFFRKIHPART